MGRNGKARTRIVCQDRRCVDSDVRRSGNGVVVRLRCHRETDDSRRGLPTGIGCGVGERVWAAVAGGRRVDVGTVGSHRHGAVQWCGVARDGERAAWVVGQHGRSVECRVRRRQGGVVHGNG